MALKPPVALDSVIYPHLLDLVLAHAPRASLLALRTVSRDMRAKSDARLARHVVLRRREDPTRACIAPITVESPDGRLPLFYLWDECEDDTLDQPDASDHRWWAVTDLGPDLQLQLRAQGARRCLAHTRVLDIAGDVPDTRLVEFLTVLRPNTLLRFLRGADGLTFFNPFAERIDTAYDVLDSPNRPLAKFVDFGNVWDVIAPLDFEHQHMCIGALKVVRNIFVEPVPHAAPIRREHRVPSRLSRSAKELVLIFRASPNPGPFTLLDRAEYQYSDASQPEPYNVWAERMRSGFRDDRLTAFWEWIFTCGAPATLVNLAALDDTWGLNEEAALRRRKAESEANVRFLTLDEYRQEVGAAFELEAEEREWCHWKPEPPTEREKKKAMWRLDHWDSDSDEFDESEDEDEDEDDDEDEDGDGPGGDDEGEEGATP